MKVREIIKKFRLCSNATVIIQNVETKDIIELKTKGLRHDDPEYVMNMKVNTFDIIDNVFTIYVQ